MAADPTYLDMPDDLSGISEEELSDPDAISAVERALQGARGAEFSARVARSNADACRIESSSAEISAGTARLAASGADSCADRAESWADISRLCADRAEIAAGRAEKAQHDVRRIGWSVALVGVGIVFGLTLALLLYVLAVWLPPRTAAPAPAPGHYFGSAASGRSDDIQERRHADPPSVTTSWI